LSETYGITVYQEQVMLCRDSWQDLPGDNQTSCVKQWGKTHRQNGDIERKFIEGGKKNGHDEKY